MSYSNSCSLNLGSAVVDFGRGQSWHSVSPTDARSRLKKKHLSIYTSPTNARFDSVCFLNSNDFQDSTIQSTLSTFVRIPKRGKYKFRAFNSSSASFYYLSSLNDSPEYIPIQPESKYLLKRNSLILASYTFISSTSSPSHGIDWKKYEDDGSLVHGWRNINPKHTFLSPGSARFRKIRERNHAGGDVSALMPFHVTKRISNDTPLDSSFITPCFDQNCSESPPSDEITNVLQDTARPTLNRQSDDLFSDYRLEFPNAPWSKVGAAIKGFDDLPPDVRKTLGYSTNFELRVLKDIYAEPNEYIRLSANSKPGLGIDANSDSPSLILKILDSAPTLSFA